MKRFMKNVSTFKVYMTSVFRPHYLREYVLNLSEMKLEWFYNQMKEPLEFLNDESYLFYKFFWIKDRDFDDLSLEIYLEYLANSEGFTHKIIKPEWKLVLNQRYSKYL